VWLLSDLGLEILWVLLGPPCVDDFDFWNGKIVTRHVSVYASLDAVFALVALTVAVPAICYSDGESKFAFGRMVGNCSQLIPVYSSYEFIE
jgi:hypothetical protein